MLYSQNSKQPLVEFGLCEKEKGLKTNPNKYRGLSMGSTICNNLFIYIILERIRPWCEAQQEQN